GLMVAVGFILASDDPLSAEQNLVLNVADQPLRDSLVRRAGLAATLAILIDVLDDVLVAAGGLVHSGHRQPSFLLVRLGRISNSRHFISLSTESRLIPRSPRMNRLNVP